MITVGTSNRLDTWAGAGHGWSAYRNLLSGARTLIIETRDGSKAAAYFDAPAKRWIVWTDDGEEGAEG
jgi:hypothetical protein